MNRLLLLVVSAIVVTACGSGAVNNVAATNVNAEPRHTKTETENGDMLDPKDIKSPHIKIRGGKTVNDNDCLPE